MQKLTTAEIRAIVATMAHELVACHGEPIGCFWLFEDGTTAASGVWPPWAMAEAAQRMVGSLALIEGFDSLEVVAKALAHISQRLGAPTPGDSVSEMREVKVDRGEEA